MVEEVYSQDVVVENVVVENEYKPLQIAGKWILHISYFIFLLVGEHIVELFLISLRQGGFGGLVSAINERDVLGRFMSAFRVTYYEL